jgi:hypothetical protein
VPADWASGRCAVEHREDADARALGEADQSVELREVVGMAGRRDRDHPLELDVEAQRCSPPTPSRQRAAPPARCRAYSRDGSSNATAPAGQPPVRHPQRTATAKSRHSEGRHGRARAQEPPRKDPVGPRKDAGAGLFTRPPRPGGWLRSGPESHRARAPKHRPNGLFRRSRLGDAQAIAAGTRSLRSAASVSTV